MANQVITFWQHSPSTCSAPLKWFWRNQQSRHLTNVFIFIPVLCHLHRILQCIAWMFGFFQLLRAPIPQWLCHNGKKSTVVIQIFCHQLVCQFKSTHGLFQFLDSHSGQTPQNVFIFVESFLRFHTNTMSHSNQLGFFHNIIWKNSSVFKVMFQQHFQSVQFNQILSNTDSNWTSKLAWSRHLCFWRIQALAICPKDLHHQQNLLDGPKQCVLEILATIHQTSFPLQEMHPTYFSFDHEIDQFHKVCSSAPKYSWNAAALSKTNHYYILPKPICNLECTDESCQI